MPNDTEVEKTCEVCDQYGQPIPKWVSTPDKKGRELTKEMIEKLRAPFPPEALEVLTYGAKLTTIKAMYVIERLNDVFGTGRWIHHHKIISVGKDVIALGRLEILDYDVIVPEQYGGMSGANADSYKGAVTNSLSKCASYLGVGIDVFKGNIGENEINAGKQKKEQENKQKEAEQYIVKIKQMLNDHTPNMTGPTALKLFRDLTGLTWTSFKATPAQAKAGYTALLSKITPNDNK